jgi:hypothetical protein
VNSSKQQYLMQVRANSAYPVYRGMIGLIAWIGYIAAACWALSGIIGFFVGMQEEGFLAGLGVLIVGTVLAALTFLFARLSQEASLILVDIGDALTESHSLQAQQVKSTVGNW